MTRLTRRSPGLVHLLLAAAALVAATAAPLHAQIDIVARSAQINFGGRLHSQFATSSAEGAKATDFFTRRARFTLDITVSDLLDARVQPDFGGGELDVKDAYFRLNLDDGFRLSVGQFKRAFDLFELNSSTDIVVVERTGRIDGAGGCAGPGGNCSLSRFTEKLAYADRDVGVKAEGSIGERIGYMATLTNGTGTAGADENSGKSAAGRLSLQLADAVSISANVSRHDFTNRDGDPDGGTAFGADLDIGGFRDGAHLQVGVVAGANWRMDPSPTGEVPRFLTGQAILSRYVPLAGDGLAGVEPMARVSWGDPDRSTANDAGLLLTPGIFLYISGKNRIGANLDVYRAGSSPAGAGTGGRTEFSFKLQTYLYY